jgi:hypothetical protein
MKQVHVVVNDYTGH